VIAAIRNTAPILLVLGAVGAALSSTACGSSPAGGDGAGSPSESNDTSASANVLGTYQADGSTPILYLEFQDATRYVTLRKDTNQTARWELGTYVFDAARTHVTFSPAADPPYTVPFAVDSVTAEGPSGQSQPQVVNAGNLTGGSSASLTGGSSTLRSQAQSLTVDGAKVTLVSGPVQAWCGKDEFGQLGSVRLVFPDLETARIGTAGQGCGYKGLDGSVFKS
jgi:hypothetical protein